MLSLEEKIRNVLADAYPGKKFDFAAIIEREERIGRWDLVISAPWIDDNQFIEDVAPRLSKILSNSELINLGILEALRPTSEFMQEYNQRIRPSAEDRDLFNITLAGIPVRHAHVFGSESSFIYA